MNLFVYGTLRPGAKTAWSRQLLRSAAHHESARMRGVLYDLGRYPGMVLGGGAWVYGDVVRLRAPSDILAEIDAYEGREFERVRSRALTRSGAVDCWVYVYTGSRRAAARITTGDYLRPLADNGSLEGVSSASSHRPRRVFVYGCLRYLRRSAF